MPLELAKRSCALKWIICAVFLTGCGVKQPRPPADSLTLPPPPSLSTPLPSTPYTTTAADDMELWQKKLQATRLMSEPIAKPGQ